MKILVSCGLTKGYKNTVDGLIDIECEHSSVIALDEEIEALELI